MAQFESMEKAVEARREAIESLLLRGRSQQSMAREFGLSESTISVDVARVRARWRADRATVDEQRDLEIARLDDLYDSMIERARAGNRGAADICLKCISRRARLLGLNAPERLELAAELSVTADPRYLAAISVVLEEVAAFPELRARLAQRLAALETASPVGGEIIEGEFSTPQLSAHEHDDDE